jgi:hypothetical protein
LPKKRKEKNRKKRDIESEIEENERRDEMKVEDEYK